MDEELRRELERVRAELEKAQRELEEIRAQREERVRERRLRAALAGLGDLELIRVAEAAATALEDERLANRTRELARLVATPPPVVEDLKKTAELRMARERAIRSLRERIVGSLVSSDPTVATLSAIWGARLRK